MKVLIAIPDGDVKNTFLPASVLAFAEENFSVIYNTTGRQLTQAELRELLQDCDAIVTGWENAMLDESVLSGNEKLKWIAHTGGTVGNLVDDYVYSRGIRVMSGNTLFAESVAEGVLSYMLMAQRRIPEHIDMVRRGDWRTENPEHEGLLGRTVGIVGFGGISKILIRMLKLFHVRIKFYSSYDIPKEFLEENNCERAGLDEIFSTCDIVSLHSSLNAKTRGMITKHHFDLLRDGALFINTARGEVVDETSLMEALSEKRFRAVLDVFHEEPLPAGSPLRKMENVYPIPHMGGPTADLRGQIALSVLKELKAVLNGQDGSALEISQETAKRMTKM